MYNILKTETCLGKFRNDRENLIYSEYEHDLYGYMNEDPDPEVSETVRLVIQLGRDISASIQYV